VTQRDPDSKIQKDCKVSVARHLVAEKPRFGCPLGLILIRLARQKFLKSSEEFIEIYYFVEMLGR